MKDENYDVYTCNDDNPVCEFIWQVIISPITLFKLIKRNVVGA